MKWSPGALGDVAMHLNGQSSYSIDYISKAALNTAESRPDFIDSSGRIGCIRRFLRVRWLSKLGSLFVETSSGLELGELCTLFQLDQVRHCNHRLLQIGSVSTQAVPRVSCGSARVMLQLTNVSLHEWLRSDLVCVDNHRVDAEWRLFPWILRHLYRLLLDF